MSEQTTDRYLAEVESLRNGVARIKSELAKVIVGQDTVVDELLLAMLARGHCLLEGVPGLAKTLLVSSLARVLELPFKRIQFTPDLMPSGQRAVTVLSRV